VSQIYARKSYCHILIKLEFSRQIFEKSRNTKFHENQSNGRRVFPSARTEERKDGRTDMPKLMVAFRNFAKKHREANVINHIYALF